MATSIQTPATYVEERNLPPVITSVPSNIPVFIGYTGKTVDTKGVSILFKPTRIYSLSEYEQNFGGEATAENFCLYPSVKLFFENGGKTLFILSCGDYTAPVSLQPLLRGLSRSRKMEVPLIAVPDAVYIAEEEDFYKLYKKILQRCAEKNNRFAVLDTRRPTKNINNDITSFRSNIGPDNLKWGAVYYPWLKTTTGKLIPPSGAVCAVYANTDETRGVWKAPANTVLLGVSATSVAMNDVDNEMLNTDTNEGKSVNAIRSFAGRGILVWGARTLAGNDNEWRYVPVKRFFILLEESIKKSTSWAVFEPNDTNTWVKIRGTIENYLTTFWKIGALQGVKSEQAFYVHCGLGSTMTTQDITEGKMIVDIGLAMLRPAEFIVLRFVFKMQES